MLREIKPLRIPPSHGETMRSNSILIGSLLALLCGQASGQTVALYTSSENLTKSCRAYLQLARLGKQTNSPQMAFDAGFCQGIVYSAMDVNSMHSEEIRTSEALPAFCVPDTVNGNDAVEVVANFIDNRPDLRTLAGYTIVRRALAATWPCR